MSDASPLLTTENLTKIYASGRINVTALSEVSLFLPEGRFLGVTGSSGSGKSTLMNLLGGLDTPSSGRIVVENVEVSDLGKEALALYRRHTVGMIFQSFNLISSFSAAENVALPLLFAGRPKKERLTAAAGLLEAVGLAERKHHRPSELSGGEQQRVAIARALVNSPRVLLADEPTGNLDSRTSRDILELVARMNRDRNLTVVMVSHEVSLLKEFADSVIRLSDGRIVDGEERR